MSQASSMVAGRGDVSLLHGAMVYHTIQRAVMTYMYMCVCVYSIKHSVTGIRTLMQEEGSVLDAPLISASDRGSSVYAGFGKLWEGSLVPGHRLMTPAACDSALL